MRRLICPLVGSVVLALALLPAAASACARDGVPSVSVDGHLAVLNRSTTRILPATWTPFVFTRAVLHGRDVTLAENNREVARALPRDAFRHPWQWDFGDGTRAAYGTRVRHTYRKSGTFRIDVRAYFPTYGSWLVFDDVTIHVH